MKNGKKICNNCKKEYFYENIGDRFPGGKEKEEVVCPYCKKIDFYIMTSGYVKTSKIEEEEN